MKSSMTDYFLPKSLTPASPFDRLAAHLIDTVLLILTFLMISISAGAYGFIISSLISVGYFIFCHRVFGQTLGKKIIGIKLISVRPESLSLGRIIFRETIGRAFSVLFFFIGYIRILWNKDRRGYHDYFSGSAVVSQTNFQTSFAHLMGILFAVLLSGSFSVYYLFFKTPFVAKVALSVLQGQGMQIQNLTGNMSQGWHIDFFRGGNQAVSYSIKGIHIYHNPSGFYSQGVWKANDVAIDQITIQVAPQLLQFSKYSENFFSSSIKSSPSRVGFFLFNLKSFAEKIKIKQMTITDGQVLTAQFENLQISQVKYQNGLLSAEGAKTEGKEGSGQVEVTQFLFKPLEQILNIKLKMQLAKKAHTAFKKDFSFYLNWSGPLSRPERMKLMAFENRFNVDLERKQLIVQLKDLTPANYVNAAPAFRLISGRFQNSQCESLSCLQKLQGYGSFFIRQKKIDFKNDRALLAGFDAEVLKFSYLDLVSSLFSPVPVLKVVSEDSLQNFMSQFYFSKNYQEISENEQQIVQQDQTYFKVMKERFDPNKPQHRDTFLIRSPADLSESR